MDALFVHIWVCSWVAEDVREVHLVVPAHIHLQVEHRRALATDALV